MTGQAAGENRGPRHTPPGGGHGLLQTVYYRASTFLGKILPVTFLSCFRVVGLLPLCPCCLLWGAVHSPAAHCPCDSSPLSQRRRPRTMHRSVVVALVVALALPVAVLCASATPSKTPAPLGSIIIPYSKGAWSYLEGKAPLPAWKTSGFDASSWKVGVA